MGPFETIDLMLPAACDYVERPETMSGCFSMQRRVDWSDHQAVEGPARSPPTNWSHGNAGATGFMTVRQRQARTEIGAARDGWK
jgi:hypothetical protein